MKKTWSAREIDSFVQLSSLINSSLDITEVLDTSMHIVEKMMDAERSAIFEIDYDTNELFFRLMRRPVNATAQKVRIRIGEGIAGWVASTGEAVFIPDTEKEERFSKKVDSLTNIKTRSILAAPIRNRNRIIGVVEVLNLRHPFSCDNSRLDILTIAANQIGIAIDNALLYERLKEKFVMTRDELKKTQQKLIQTERMAALGELARGVAHAIRNPVMSIGGFTRRLRKKISMDETAAGYIDVILEETSRLEKIVRDVGNHTAMRKPDCSEVRMSVLIRTVLKSWKEKHGAGDTVIETDLMPEDPVVIVDIRQMAEAVNHLLENASEAMPEGGRIVISTTREGGSIVVSVRDSGGGIDPAEMPLVFDPFFTTKTYGSGLGLNTVKRIVNDHGGEVRILCCDKTGTEVRIHLPQSHGEEIY